MPSLENTANDAGLRKVVTRVKRYRWRWLKPPAWLRVLLRRRRAREWRRSESARRALEQPDPDLAAKWANLVAKTRSAAGLPLLDD